MFKYGHFLPSLLTFIDLILRPPKHISSMKQDDIVDELLKYSSQLENANLSEESEEKVITGIRL